jgi:hypothetical protein
LYIFVFEPRCLPHFGLSRVQHSFAAADMHIPFVAHIASESLEGNLTLLITSSLACLHTGRPANSIVEAVLPCFRASKAKVTPHAPGRTWTHPSRRKPTTRLSCASCDAFSALLLQDDQVTTNHSQLMVLDMLAPWRQVMGS